MFLILTFILFASIVSCNNEAGSQSSSSSISNSSINSKTGLPFPNNTAQVGLNPEHGKPGHRCDIAVGAPLTDPVNNTTAQANTFPNIPANNEAVQPTTTATTIPTTTAAPGMNPQHGQPGHRCDIAVGAPLNSPVKSNSTQTNTTATTKVAPGMNPQHGQPGHRCDIAVGSPLADTAKIKATPVNTSQITAATQIADTSANATTNFVEKPAEKTISAVVPGLNPKHGEPGHRCDIAVGAPLNSKPKQ